MGIHIDLKNERREMELKFRIIPNGDGSQLGNEKGEWSDLEGAEIAALGHMIIELFKKGNVSPVIGLATLVCLTDIIKKEANLSVIKL